MLREIIRRLILEVYELELEDSERQAELEQGLEDDGFKPAGQHGKDSRRALGLQNKDEISKDRSFLQDYQNRINNTIEGRKMIKAFQKGDIITTIHSIEYEGYAETHHSKERESQKKSTRFTSWLQRWGKQGKNAISCVAWNDRLDSGPYDTGENGPAFTEGIGFVMTGYPIFVSENDVMSQTLGAVPKGLMKHQANSGIAKRASEHSQPWYGISGEASSREEWDWAGEVLLDNWKVVGIYINFGAEMLHWDFDDYCKNAVDTGLPLYLFDGLEYLGTCRNYEDCEQWLGPYEDWLYENDMQ
jgi:hypothetical protein